MVELSIIIISFNTKEFTLQCIKSILLNPLSVNFEIVVVDNNSEDGTVYALEKEFRDIDLLRIIKMPQNLGFSKANNIGVKFSKGNFLLFLNSDTLIVDNSIDKLLDFIKSDEKIGIVGPKLINPDGSFQPQSKRGIPTLSASFLYFLKLYKIFPKSKIFGEYLQTYKDENSISEVPCISGSCMLVKKSIFEKVSGFDERYFLHFEDIDLCLKFSKAGYKIYYYPHAKVIHFKGKSSVDSHKMVNKYFLESFEKFYIKNLKDNYPKFLNLLFLKFYKLLTICLNFLTK